VRKSSQDAKVEELSPLACGARSIRGNRPRKVSIRSEAETGWLIGEALYRGDENLLTKSAVGAYGASCLMRAPMEFSLWTVQDPRLAVTTPSKRYKLSSQPRRPLNSPRWSGHCP
jgi:hypothetical protein